MVFYYHMFGEDVGELNVYVRFYSNGPLQKLYGISGNLIMFCKVIDSIIFIRLGHRGNLWIRHELKLDYTTPFQVIIEGVIGISFLSDIGLDDTIFSPECTPYPNLELPETTIITTTTPKPCPIADQVHCAGSDICIDKDKVRNF